MEKREFDKQKARNADIVNDIIEIETNTDNLTDEMEIVTEKEFGQFISDTDKISSKGKRSQKAKHTANKMDVEEAKRDVKSELERAYDVFNRLNGIARRYNLQGTEFEEDDFVLDIQMRVFKLYDELKRRPLKSEEFSDLVELSRQMNFNELVRNYVDAGRTVTRDRIEKLEKEENNRVLMIFKPIVTKFKEKFTSFKENTLDEIFKNPEADVDNTYEQTKRTSLEYEDYIKDVNDELFELLLEDNFEESLDKEFSDEELDNLLKVTDELKAKYDEVNLPTEDGFYSIDNITERDARWSKYADSLIETIGELQAMHLKNCYSDIRKYAVTKSSSGTILCQVGDDYIPVSKDHLVDDIALLYSKVEEYEKSKQEVAEISSEEKEGIVNIEPTIIEAEVTVDEPQEVQIEVPEKEEVKIEIPEEPVQETKIEIESTSEPKEVATEPIIELEEPEEIISPSKQAYIEVMSCFVDRDEAVILATDENIRQFEASNLGYSKYIDAINSGELDNGVSYESFVVDQIQKDNGIKYDDLEEELETNRDNSELDISNSEENPVIIENVEADLSGIDMMVSSEDPLAFTDNTPITRSR